MNYRMFIAAGALVLGISLAGSASAQGMQPGMGGQMQQGGMSRGAMGMEQGGMRQGMRSKRKMMKKKMMRRNRSM